MTYVNWPLPVLKPEAKNLLFRVNHARRAKSPYESGKKYDCLYFFSRNHRLEKIYRLRYEVGKKNILKFFFSFYLRLRLLHNVSRTI